MSKPNILVVDDEKVIRNFLVRVLEREGYRVQAASDGQEALADLSSGHFDLLLTDIKMDRLDGVELLARARAMQADLAVILLTGHATVPSAVAALRQGAHNYLLKPVKNEEIVAAVSDALEDRVRQQKRDQLEAIASQMRDVLQDGVHDTATQGELGVRLYTCGDLVVDLGAYTVTLDGKQLTLTPTEFRLLAYLVQSPGIAFDYVHLVEAACGYSCTRQEAREIIGTHVLNLRNKLAIEPARPLYVESVRGVGYRLTPPPDCD